MKLRETIKNRIEIESSGSGVNKRKIIQRAVYEELVNMLSPIDVEPFKPVKGKSNVIMFVGLQVAFVSFSSLTRRVLVRLPPSVNSLHITERRAGRRAWCVLIHSVLELSTS